MPLRNRDHEKETHLINDIVTNRSRLHPLIARRESQYESCFVSAILLLNECVGHETK